MPYMKRIFKYDAAVKRRSKVWAHDEYELCRPGDVVRSMLGYDPLAKSRAIEVATPYTQPRETYVGQLFTM